MDARESELPLAQSRDIAVRVREELARRHMSRLALADTAKISLSTLEKALNGSRPFTLATLIRLETALGLALRPRQEAEPALIGPAAADLGAYSHGAVKWLEGDYLTLRPSFGGGEAIYAYRTTVAWDSRQACLTFHESDREDAPFAQKGVVSVPNKSGHIYLHTNVDGQFRLAILGRPLISGEMYGLLSTLKAGAGGHLTPAAVAIALIPMAQAPGVIGRITPDAAAYPACRAHLDRIVDGGFALLLDMKGKP